MQMAIPIRDTLASLSTIVDSTVIECGGTVDRYGKLVGNPEVGVTIIEHAM